MNRPRFIVACVVAAIVILWAPYVSEVRRWIRAQFPGQFVLVVGSAIAVMIGTALLAALLRIRERRLLRYGAIAAAVVLGVAWSLRFSTGRPESDVVEHFHFVQFGIVTLLFYRAWRPVNDVSMFVLPVLAGLIVGTLEEWFQWFIPVRVGEMRDIFLNLAAITTGLLFSVAVDPPPSFTASLGPGSLRRIGRVAAVVVLAIAGFFHAVHLGYEIRDDEIGAFRSRYTASRLAQLSADRASAWRANPPPLRSPRLAREDQYLTEAMEHTMWRNKRWDAGDIVAAWYENRILEEYYAPTLDTPSYHSPSGFRWPAEQRANAEHATVVARAMSPGSYVSLSNLSPMYVWPKWLFWSGITALIVVLLAASAMLDRARRVEHVLQP